MNSGKVYVVYNHQKILFSLDTIKTPMDILEKLDLYIDDTLIVRNGKPIPCDEKLNDDDTIHLIRVASGG